MYPKDNPETMTSQPIAIRAAIRSRYGSISEFCRSTGANRVYVYAVIRGEKKSQEYARIISEAVGKSPAEIWPTLYSAAEPAA